MNPDPNAGSLDVLVRCHPDWIGPWQNAPERKCPDCGCRVPQYDKELELARLEVKDWQDVAAQLYAAMGLSRRERRRVHAENAYRKLLQRGRAPGCSRDDWSPNAAVSDGSQPFAPRPGSAYGYVCPGCGEQIYDGQDVVDTDDGMAHGDCVK